MKKIIQFLLFLFLLLFQINNSFADEKIDIIANFEDSEENKYNYFYISFIGNDGIICKGMSRQYFENIKVDGQETFLKKVKESGVSRFECDKEKIVNENGNIKADIVVKITSDGFYKMNNGEMILELNNKQLLSNNTIVVGNYDQAQYKLLIGHNDNKYYNKFSSNIDQIEEQILREQEKEERLNKEKENIREINFEINNVPEDIEVIKYRINDGTELEYIPGQNNNFISGKIDNIDIINFDNGSLLLENIKINNNEVIIEYDSDMVKTEIQFNINIKNIPDIKRQIYVKFGNNNAELYDTNKMYVLNKSQIQNGFKLKIGDLEYDNIKLEQTETLNVSYDKIFNIKEEENNNDNTNNNMLELDNNYLAIELDKTLLDGLGRLAYYELKNNGGTEKKVIPADNIFLKGNNIFIENFIGKDDIMIKEIVINNKNFNIKDISINYNEFMKNR